MFSELRGGKARHVVDDGGGDHLIVRVEEVSSLAVCTWRRLLCTGGGIGRDLGFGKGWRAGDCEWERTQERGQGGQSGMLVSKLAYGYTVN